jgi:pseudaminic acid synthase
MFEINRRKISCETRPYVIAELSANHDGSFEKAVTSIRAAKASGADAVKLQTYTPETMTIDCVKPDFLIEGGLWNGYTLHELYQEAHTPWEWHKPLFDEAKKVGVDIFSTPFDESAVDLLESLGAPAYKIASFELTDHPLVAYTAAKGKPLLMSTGMATETEISESLEVARSAGAKDILLFHCVSAYPAPTEDYNLSMITELRKNFGVEVGLSDHTIGNQASIIATALGASAIEKHFTLDRSAGGPDSQFSVEPNELISLTCAVNETFRAIGPGCFKRADAELENKKFRRSIYFMNDLTAGSVVTERDVKRIRPGYGLPPKMFESLIGKTITADVERGDPTSLENIGGGGNKDL